ncbi:hypothetical protein MEQU1_001082 [Malassezia equina]|uniref:RRM domain-containing protein n=1 Tax=Malassezia equina TaxID=1381935 RepID=A0AAF0EHF9_9BASI|nr:hypothetical protein MEQU1_001082 [Malassezia equina]
MSDAAASTLFVGSISPGVSDRWLVQLFQACGGYRSFKRVSKAFGFADFSTLRDALRVLSVLHDLELPSMGAQRNEPRKKLIVRADEKTSAFLGEFAKTMVRTDADALEDAAAKNRVDYVVQAMATPNAEAGDEPERFEIPSHLKDLQEDEIPEERRSDVISEIEKFRLGAVARDAAARRRELDMERKRAAALAAQQQRASSSPRVAETPETPDVDPEAADEAAESARRAEEQEAHARAARAAEAEYEPRERARLERWAARQPTSDHTAAHAAWAHLTEDQELKQELFWTDRRRWLATRATERTREEVADDADRACAAQQRAEAERQADEFLAQLAPQGLRPSGAPLKLHVHRHDDMAHPLAHMDATQRAAHIDGWTREALWALVPLWDTLDIAAFRPLLDCGIAESFGESVPDLVDAAMEQLEAHASAADVADVLAPVLDDDAAVVVDTLWRALLVGRPGS